MLSRKLYLPALKEGALAPPKIVAVDLQPMAPIEGVTQLQGDITSEATALQVAALVLTLLMLIFAHTHDALPFQSYIG